MGLLTLLSRRSGRFQSKEDLCQSQQTTPLQISRPVSVSTSSSIYGTRSTPCQSETQLSESSPNQAKEINAAKPPPLLNQGFRGVLEHYRPASAHSFRSTNSDRPKTLQRPKREARKPPVSFRKPSSLLSTQSSGTTETQHTSQLGENESEAISFTEGRERAESMSSLARRLSKDLLDAVDEFRPLDFRSRVQAAGARDYGEDVADRNLRSATVLSTTVSSPNLYSHFSSGRSHSSQSASLNSRTKSINSMNEHYNSTPRAQSAQADHHQHHHHHERPELFTRRNKNRLSLNTYKPSGFVSPVLQTPRSSATTPGHRGGMTPSDLGSPEARHEMWSRQYHLSPVASNFSLPRSPKTVRHTTTTKAQEPQPLPYDEVNHSEDTFPDELQSGDVRRMSKHSEQRKSAASGDAQGSTRNAARFSQGTYRSSLASSMTSRNPSMDFTPLGYPKQNNSKAHFDTASNTDDPSLWRSQSLRSHRHSRSNSSGNAHSQSRTRSLLNTTAAAPPPSSLTDLIEADGTSPPPPPQQQQQRNSGTHDWAVLHTSSTTTDSASSSSNGLFSGGGGSIRPASRHTKSTSLDSLPPRPVSSQSSGVSASVGQQSGSGWSPTTTRSTGFNIDDYVSSDDDSFITTTKKRRPTAEGEEELLFKGSYGATGAALPGLLESMIFGGARSSSPPPRVVGFRGTSQVFGNPPPLTEEEGEDGEEAGEAEDFEEDAAEGPDIDDVRPMGHVRGQPFTPPFSQTQHYNYAQQQQQQGGDRETTYHRNLVGKQLSAAKPRAQSNNTPSWLPSDDWVRPGSRISGQIKRPTTSSSTTSNTGFMSSEDGMRSPTARGQTRLSALGTLPLRNPTVVAADLESVKKSTHGGSSSINSKEPRTSWSGKDESSSDPAAVAVRLRKEAKSRKREQEAKTIREKRMTRAFGSGGGGNGGGAPRNDEEALAALQEQEGDGEMETRGRTRVRIPKGGKVVMISS